MKLNTRNLALASAFVGFVSLAGMANAGVSYYLAYGDDLLVKLAKSNQFPGGPRDAAAALGSKIPTDRALRIPKIADGVSFKVDVHLVVDSTTSGSPLSFNSGGMFVGIGKDTTGATNYADKAAFEAAEDTGALTVGGATAAASVSNLATGIAGTTGGSDGNVDMQFQGSPFLSGNFGSGSTLRSVGLGFAYIFGAGNSAKLNVGTDIRAFTIELKNRGLANFATNSDNGISLNANTNATSRSNFVVTSPKADGYPTTTAKYAVEAVPEPGSVLAIAAGLAALGLRRRSK